MTLFDDSELKEKHTKFLREYNRVEPYKSRIPLTKNETLKLEYRKALVRTYNDLLTYLVPIVRDSDSDQRVEIQNLLIECLRKLKDCFNILSLEYPFSATTFDEIDIEKVTEIETAPQQLAFGTGDLSDQELNSSTANGESNIQNSSATITPPFNTTVNSTPSRKMAQTKDNFIALANRIIHSKFSGDPLALDSFIDSIKLLDSLCEADNKALLIPFLMTRLEGEAREAIEEIPVDVDELIDELKEHIKPENSKVIAGRILALRADKTSLFKFSERAEELAEQYRRSLCREGFTKEKAKAETVEKIVDLCRVTARNERVQAIIAAKTFTEPKDVIAQMIIEINNLKLDRSATQYKHNNKHKNGQNKNGNNRYSNSRSGNSNGNSNSYRNSNGSNSQSGNSYKQNSQNNGNGNGNYSRGRNNYNNYNSRTFTNSNGNKNRNDQSVRFYSGNEMNPGNGGQTTEQTQ